MKTAITAIFIFTYAMIASRRLRLLPIGRPGGALLGAVAMVAIGAISPAETYVAIDHQTIILLFAMMLFAVYLDDAGFFVRIGSWLVARARTPWRLLVGISLLSALSSAVLLNDTVCVFLTPLVVMTCRRAELPMGPYLIALATSANIGSAATVVGNPQNILIGSMSKMHFLEFSALAIVPTVIGVVINIALLRLYYRKVLPTTLDLDPKHQLRVPTGFVTSLEGRPKIPLALLALAGVTVGFLYGLDRGYTALAGVCSIVLFTRKDPREQFGRVDWPLLVFFSSLFIVVATFAKTGFVEEAWTAVSPHVRLESVEGVASFTAVMTIGSNLVSNVPLVMITGPYFAAQSGGIVGWVLLGFVTTIAGNLTIVGSVANIIVAEAAREHYSIGFREYLRFGAVSTVLVLAAGVPAMLVLARWIG